MTYKFGKKLRKTVSIFPNLTLSYSQKHFSKKLFIPQVLSLYLKILKLYTMKKLLLILAVLFALTANAQGFKEIKRAKTKSEPVVLKLGNNTLNAFKTSSGSVYIIKTSKKSEKQYKYYLGKDTGKLYKTNPVFVVGKKEKKYYYYTIDSKSLHRHRLEKD